MQNSDAGAAATSPGLNASELFAFHFYDLAASILAAFRANPVRLFLRPAVGTSGQRPYLEVVVGPALARSGLRMPAFRIGHTFSL